MRRLKRLVRRVARRTTRRAVHTAVAVGGVGSAGTTATTLLADGPTWLYPPSLGGSGLAGIYLLVLLTRRGRL
ncbi:hypothetical protein [Saccharothrix sp. HUAS TT1]|uniref:hypothetical protein n=1 Tax=unclassified Saccharothrix TaxID=2593673 RepID=UPI00345B4CD1